MIRGREWDVIVVGAGPAGATTASLLAGRGYSVLVVDRCEFPRSKACGESVNPGAIAELEQLGLLSEVTRLPHQPVRSWTIHPLRGPTFWGSFPDGEAGLAVDRGAFDRLLLEKAIADGARFLPGVQIAELLFDGTAVAGVRDRRGTEYRSRVVVGADGLRSVVMRRLGLLRRRPTLVKVGLTSHMEGVGGTAGVGELFLLPWGCVGIVHIGDRLTNVVLIVDGGVGRGAGEASEAWFDRLIVKLPAFAGAHRVGPLHVTGPFDYPTRDVVADGALLVGDAAGYFDPFTGQGIYRALKGARLADVAINRGLSNPRRAASALLDYSRNHQRAFSRGVRAQKFVESVTSRPQLFAVTAAGLRMVPHLGNLLVGVTGDLPPTAHRRHPS